MTHVFGRHCHLLFILAFMLGCERLWTGMVTENDADPAGDPVCSTTSKRLAGGGSEGAQCSAAEDCAPVCCICPSGGKLGFVSTCTYGRCSSERVGCGYAFPNLTACGEESSDAGSSGGVSSSRDNDSSVASSGEGSSAVPSGPSSLTASSAGQGSNGASAQHRSSSSGNSQATVLRCDGIDDYAEAPASSSLDLQNAITLEAWVLPLKALNEAFVSKWSASGYSYALEGADDSLPAFFISAGGSGNVVRGPNELPTGRWLHVAATYDGNTMRIFVDGVQVGSETRFGSISSGTSPVQVCARRNTGNYMLGDLDEMRVSSVARYASDFTPPQHLTSDAQTVALWDFKVGVADQSGHNNNLVLFNGASVDGQAQRREFGLLCGREMTITVAQSCSGASA